MCGHGSVGGLSSLYRSDQTNMSTYHPQDHAHVQTEEVNYVHPHVHKTDLTIALNLCPTATEKNTEKKVDFKTRDPRLS
jgi:hypothetical protein